MKILVTGGQGYIGENLQLRYEGEHFQFDSCDYGVCNPDLPLAEDLTEDDISRWKYQGIVHLAALSGIAACERDPERAIRDNILTANNVFKLASKVDIPVIFTSSQAAKDPKSSIYASMKWACENLASMYNKGGGSNYVIRLSNVYGGHEYLSKKQTCVKQFITQYNNDEPMRVHGNGTQERDFIHVYDVCEAIMKILSFRPIEKEPMDIGTGMGLTIMEMVEMFPRKKNQHFTFETGRGAGAESSIAKIIDAKLKIHFLATRKLNDYIREMIK